MSSYRRVRYDNRMMNTGIALHLVRTDATATAAHEASTSWDVTVATLAEATTHLDGYRDDTCWVGATATAADGTFLGSGRAGFGEATRTTWA